jgi:hypothetical protein
MDNVYLSPLSPFIAPQSSTVISIHSGLLIKHSNFVHRKKEVARHFQVAAKVKEVKRSSRKVSPTQNLKLQVSQPLLLPTSQQVSLLCGSNFILNKVADVIQDAYRQKRGWQQV